MKTLRTIAVGLTAALLLVGSALAITGDEVFVKSQAAMKPGEDETFTERMTITSADGQADVLELKIYRKGDRALIRVLSPEEFAGIGLLILPKEDGGEEIWLYLPAFRDVKQIVAEGLSEGFVGSDFAYEDLTLRYTDKYDVTGMSEEAGQYALTLAPKPEAQISYTAARMWVDQETFLPTRAEFDRQDRIVKVLTLSDIQRFTSAADPQRSYPTPTRIEMANVQAGSRTLIELLEVEYDTGLSDDFFTVQNLKRGE